MESVTYTVGDLKKIIAESSEFKPKFGNGVESGNKTEAGKAYKEAKKRAKDFDGGGKEDYWKGDSEYVKEDMNATTLDYTPENVDDKFKKRVQAQAEGYTSEAEKNNKDMERCGDFSGNKKTYDGIKKAGKDAHEKEAKLKATGLQAREMPDDTFKKEEMYENVKTVYFKKTEFINEDYMMNRIPDEFKKTGMRFRMKDKNNNEYLLEWKYSKAIVLEHKNKNGLNESLSRMKELMGYKTSDTETSKDIRLTEGEDKLNDSINKMRKLMK